MTYITTRLADAFHARRTDVLVLLVLSLLALVIRFGYLAEYPNSIMHEDSGPYVDEAERLLEGRATANGEIPGRAPGYPLFLAAIISLVSPKLLYAIGIQHLLGIGTALLLTLTLRMLGVGRLLSYVFFIAIAFAHRLIHYDNTIGAETLTVFLVSVNFFLVCGMTIRRWNPWICAVAIGLIFSYLILVRSATFFIPFVFAAWFSLPNVGRLHLGWPRRLVLIAIIVLPSVSAVAGMIEWNKTYYNRSVLSREAEPAMAFVIAYSGEFSEQGPKYEVLDEFPDFREKLRTIVENGRASLKDDGYSTVDHYQWVFGIFNVIELERMGTQQEKDRVVSSLFRETALNPQTLYRHLTKHTFRELRFMLLDITPVTNSTYTPLELVNFTRRDGAGLRIAKASANIEQGTGIAKFMPNALGQALQRFTNRYIHNKYTTEYRQQPGMLRIYTIASLTLLIVLLLKITRIWHWLFFSDRRRKWLGIVDCVTSERDKYRGSSISANDGVVLLAFGIWLGNALILCTLIYALHRYSYYIYAFNTFTAFYALHLLSDFIRTCKR